jgi:conjugal transfer pilus assembly protein TraD
MEKFSASITKKIKAVIDRQKNAKPIFTLFDEFSVFAGNQVLNLINMGRGKGVHAILGTQGLADLKNVDEAFERQVLNCANTVICHALNDQDSAETVAGWIGTKDVFDVTAQVNLNDISSKLGSVKKNRGFIVHPDQIKQELLPGEAFYVTKVEGFKKDKIKIKL